MVLGLDMVLNLVARRDGVDIGEAMIRLAQEQDIPVEFVSRQALTDVDGAGALLKF